MEFSHAEEPVIQESIFRRVVDALGPQDAISGNNKSRYKRFITATNLPSFFFFCKHRPGQRITGIRTAWDEEKQEWFFSIVDVCGVLTESKNYDTARKYRAKLKERLIAEGNELVTNCLQLKMVSPKDGKRYNSDVADLQGMFRIIQSIPSKKAEPIKVWIAAIAAERINQAIDPERSIDQAIADYRRLGYSEAWITRRIKTIEIRKGLTEENLREI